MNKENTQIIIEFVLLILGLLCFILSQTWLLVIIFVLNFILDIYFIFNKKFKFDGTIEVLGSKDGELGNFSLDLPVPASYIEDADEIRLRVKKLKNK